MFLRAISIISSMTLISRVLGYTRDLLIAKVLGAGLISDAFFIAFKLPNLFRRLFAEGSMNAAFIPVISGISEKSGKKKSDEFFSSIFSGLLIVLLTIILIVEIFMPLIVNLIAPGFTKNPDKFSLAVDLSRLTFPFVLFVCLTSLAGAYLNTMGKFASMAITPIILNLTMIFTLLIFNNDGNKVYISNNLSLAVSFAGILQVLWIILNLKVNGVKLKLNLFDISFFKKPKGETKRFLILLLPAVIGNGAYQLNLLIDMILASTLPDGSISYLYYADRVNQLPLGVLGIAISTALLPILSSQLKKKENKKANESLNNAIKFGIIFSIPSLFGLVLLSDEIISFLFYRGAFDLLDVNFTGSALIALAFGLPAFIIIKILVVPYFADEDTKTPIKVSIFSMIINLILNLILIKEYLHVGLAIATSVSAWINALILFYILTVRKKYFFDKTIFIIIFKVLVSSLVMIFVVNLIINMNKANLFFQNGNLWLLISIFGGALTYFFFIFILGVKNLTSISGSKRYE